MTSLKPWRSHALSQEGSCSPAPVTGTWEKNACPVLTDFPEMPGIRAFMQNLLICECWQLVQFFFPQRHSASPNKTCLQTRCGPKPEFVLAAQTFENRVYLGVFSPGYWQSFVFFFKLLYFSLKHKNITPCAKQQGNLRLQRQRFGYPFNK